MTQVEEDAPGWYLYRFFTRLPCAVPGCRIRHPLYIGKSNDPLRRWLEHAPKQPWWSAQCGYEIDDRVWPDDRSVRAAETAAIRAELPLANVAGNEGNAHRLLFDEQPVRRRVARRMPAEPVPARREWSPQQKRAAAWAGGWAVLTVALTVAALFLLPVALWPGVELGAAGSTALLAAGRYVTLSRRKRKQIRRWVGGGVTAVVVAAVVWTVLSGHVASAVSR